MSRKHRCPRDVKSPPCKQGIDLFVSVWIEELERKAPKGKGIGKQ